MVKFISWIRNHLPTQRRLIQLYTALLYNAHVKGFIKGNIYTGSSKMLCVPGFNCYSCPGAIGACPLGALQNAVASSGNRAPAYVLGILMLYGLTLGRTICGFLCPIGLMQELLHKIPTPKLRKSSVTHILSYLKYVILAVFVIIIPLWYSLQSYPLPAFCKYICPAGTFEGAVGLLSNPLNADKYSMLGVLFTRKFLILLAIVAICVFVYRAFCRFLCPLGAIYGMFSKIAVIGVKVEMPRCTDCGRCVSHCKMDIRRVGDRECIHCGECIDVCPTKAISFKAGKITLHGPEINQSDNNKKKASKLRLIVWMIAILILTAALVFFNLPDNSDKSTNYAVPSSISADEDISDVSTAAVSVGKEVGMIAPDFIVPVYGEDSLFVLSESRGKTVIVNFWATWCTPCCNELPYFDEVYKRYGENVVVVAVHSNLITDDVEAYLSKFTYQIPFALDETGEVIKAYGGSTMLPHTIIIDENGIITYNAVGSVTLEKLESLLGVMPQETATPTTAPQINLRR